MIAAFPSKNGSFRFWPLIVAGAFALSACGSDEPYVGDDVKPRFVSLNPCTDAILVEVADPDQVLALSHYSVDPQSSSIEPAIAAQFAVTGGTVEEVAALNPDFVLAGTFLAPATRGALENMGFAVATFGIASDVGESAVQVREIARLAGHAHRGEVLVARIDSSLAELDAVSMGRKNQSAVLWQPGQIVPGEQTLVAQLMQRAGFASHSAARGLGQADHVSLEQMLADPPEVLLLAGSEQGQRHPALESLAHTQVEHFDPSLLYCAGPTIIRAADRLREIRRAGA